MKPRSRRKDAMAWTLSASLILLGLVVGAMFRSTGSLAASAAPGPAALIADGSPDPGLTASSADEGRPSAFIARMAALRPLQDALSRAFAPPRPPPSARPPVRLARLAPGATPEACLAQAVYYEARGEPAEGQAAVAQVVLNRARSGRHPASLCGVVFEGAARPGCQFSFACDPRLAHRRVEPAAWRRAQEAAAATLAGRGRPDLETALNYHADDVRPRWASQLERTAEIGRHIFYAAARPVSRALTGWTFAPPPPPAATPAA